MDRKRAHEIQTHRLVSSGAGASAVSTNTFRGPTEPAAGTSTEQDRLRPAGSPQDRRGSRERRRPLRWHGESAAPCGMRCAADFLIRLQVAGLAFRIYSVSYGGAPSETCDAETSSMYSHALAFTPQAVRCLPLPRH